MSEDLKQKIDEAMKLIASRKPGKRRLVYDRATRTINVVGMDGMIIKDTGLIIGFEDANMF